MEEAHFKNSTENGTITIVLQFSSNSSYKMDPSSSEQPSYCCEKCIVANVTGKIARSVCLCNLQENIKIQGTTMDVPM